MFLHWFKRQALSSVVAACLVAMSRTTCWALAHFHPRVYEHQGNGYLICKTSGPSEPPLELENPRNVPGCIKYVWSQTGKIPRASIISIVNCQEALEIDCFASDHQPERQASISLILKSQESCVFDCFASDHQPEGQASIISIVNSKESLV